MIRRVLIDECLPVQLHRWLRGFEARTVTYMGWSGKSDAELLAAASGRFDILLTGDRRLVGENDLAAAGLAVVVVAETRRRAVEQKVDAIVEALRAATPGAVVVVA